MVLGQEQLCDEEQTLLPSSCVSLPACHLAPCSEAFGLLPMHQNRYQLEKKPFPTLFTSLRHQNTRDNPFATFLPSSAPLPNLPFMPEASLDLEAGTEPCTKL